MNWALQCRYRVARYSEIWWLHAGGSCYLSLRTLISTTAKPMHMCLCVHAHTSTYTHTHTHTHTHTLTRSQILEQSMQMGVCTHTHLHASYVYCLCSELLVQYLGNFIHLFFNTAVCCFAVAVARSSHVCKCVQMYDNIHVLGHAVA